MDTLQEVKIIGDIYFNRFKMDDGTIVEVESSAEEYASLALPKAINPTIKGGVWVNSYATRKYDTPDFKLEEGQYAIDNGCIFAIDDTTRETAENNKEAILSAKIIQK